jgi:hypothetical protein
MRKRTLVSTLFIFGAALALPVFVAASALAHEERTIGKFHVAVGFGDEPAYAGQENSVQMFIHDANDNPVTDLGPTLQVEVKFRSLTMPPLTMEPNFEVGEFGIPGDYRAFFFPTSPGDYTFHFTGTIKGTKVDRSFTSSPSTFSSVEDPSNVEFPARAPTTGDLALRLRREIPRVQRAALAAARSASDEASTAKTIGLIGIIVGAVGLVVGVVALVAARRDRSNAPASGPSQTAATTRE